MSRALRTFSVIATVMGVVFLGTPVSAAVVIDVPSTPSAPVATVVKDKSVTVTWAAPTATGGAPVTSYEVLKDGTPVATTAGRVFTLSPLEGDSMVSITVKACNVVGCSFDSDALIVTTKPAPASALRLAPGNALIAVSWVESTTIGIGDHSLWYRTNTTSTWTEWTPGVADTTGTVITGLQNGTTYIVKIRTTSSKGWNDTASAIATPMGVPARPTVFYTRISPTAVVLAWTWPATTTAVPRHFDVYKDGEKVITTTGRYQAVVKLTPLTEYSFTVTACNVAGCSEPAPPLNVTLPPPPPTGVTLTPGTNKLSVSWVASPTASYHSVWYKILGAASWSEHTPGVADTSPVDLSGLTGGSTYLVKVGAHNSSGIAAYSPLAAAMPVGAPAAPSAVQQVSATSTTATISWPTPSNGGSAITSYKLFTDGVLFSTLTAPANTAVVVGLLEGSSYNVTLQACNVVGCSSDSNVLAAHTAPPAALTVAATPASTSAIITWTAPTASAITGYRVFYRQLGRPIWLQLSSASFDSSGVVIPGLNVQTSYEVLVRTYNPVSYTDSAPVSFSTLTFLAPSSPQNVSATAGVSSARLSWTAPASNGGSAVTNYTIEFSSDSGVTWSSYVKPVSTALSASVVGLQTGLSYSFRVSAVNVAGASAPQIASSSVTPFGAPQAPTGLAGTPALSQVTLSWVAPVNNGGSPITDYLVAYSTNGSTWSVFSDGTSTATSATVTGLTNGVPYYFRVAAANAGGAGAYATLASTVTPVSVAMTPTRVVGTPGSSQVVVSWSPPAFTGGSRITDYAVESSQDSGVTWVPVADGVSASTTTTVTGLTNGTSYVFRVAAVNATGVGAPSVASLPVTPRTTPSAPTGVTATAANASVSVSWTVPGSNGGNTVSDYLVQYSSSNGAVWRTFADGVKTTTAATVTRLTNGTNYIFRVAAVNGAGAGIYSSPTQAVTPSSTPGVPTAVAVSSGDQQATVAWSAPSSSGGSPITDFTVAYSSNAGATWTVFNDGVSTSTRSTVTGLSNGTSYVFKVAASNVSGSGGFSTPTTAVFIDPTLTSPTNVSGDAGDSSVFLSWSAPVRTPPSILDYLVQYSTDGGSTWITHVRPLSSAPWASITGLTNQTPYVFKVAAVSSFGVGSYSEISAPVTPHGGVTAVQNLAAAPANQSVNLSWEYPASDGGAAVSSYAIARSSNGGSTWVAVVTLTAPALAHTVTGLSNGTSYVFRVIADNGAGGTPSTVSATPGSTPSAPLSVTTANVAGEISVSWSAPASNGGYSITDYEVQHSSDAGNTWSSLARAPSSSTSGTLTGLTAGATYVVRVAAINALGAGPYSASSAPLVLKTAPAAPENLLAVPGNGSASLTWSAPASDGGASINNYVIQFSSNGGTTWSSVSRGASSALSALVSSLSNGTSYVFKVAAVNAVGTGAWSSVSSAITPSTVPSVVQSLASAPADSSVELSWSAPASSGGSNVVDYIIQYSSDAGTTWVTFNDGVSASSTALVASLSNGTSYVFRVAAVNAAGTGATSSSVSATPRTTPDAPTNLSGTAGTGAIDLAWDMPVSNGGASISTYVVQHSSDSGATWVSFAHAASAATSLNITGLANGTSYIFRVAAVNAAGTGIFSSVSSPYTPGALLDAPTALVGIGQNQAVSLSWAAPPVPSGVTLLDYEVLHSSDNGSTWITAADGVSTAPSSVIGSLTNGTSYVFKVAAVTAGGSGSFSSQSAPVTPYTTPQAPSSVTPTAGDLSATLSWAAPSSNGGAAISDYTIQYSSNGGTSWSTFSRTASTATSATVTGLTNGTSYVFRVAAVNQAGTGGYSGVSAPVTPVAPATTPDAPTAVSGTAGDAQVWLTWSAPASDGGATITDYVVQHSSNAGSSWTTFADAVTTARWGWVTGLTNGTSYVFRVAAVNTAGTGSFSAASAAVTPAGAPSAPTITSLTPGNASVTVAWSEPASNGGAPITAYEIEVVEAVGGTPYTVTVIAPTSSGYVGGMTNGVQYLVTVRALNGVTPGVFSSAISVTPATTPSAPSVPSVTAGNGQASLTWFAPTSNGGSELNDYVIQYSSNGGGSWTTFNDGESLTTSATVTGLTNGTSYVFRVAAKNVVGTGLYSSASLSTTPISAPTAPLSVAGTPGNASIAMTWAVPSSNGGAPITDYVVQYFSLAGSTWATFNDGVSTATSATVTGLINGTAYMVRVAAVNSVGQGAWSALIPQITPATTPGTPTALTATPLALSVSLSWAAPASNGANISDYVIQYSSNSGGSWTTFPHAASSSTSITVTGLSTIPYVFRIAAVNSVGQGSYTAATASVTPSAVATVPGAPTGVTGTVGSSQVSLSWTAPANIGGSLLTDYTITYSSNNWASSTTFPHAASTATSIVVTGLTNGTTYQFKVAAVNSVGQGPFSTASANRTPAGVPNAPVINSSTSSGGDIEVRFNPPSNNGAVITSYTLRCVSSNGGSTRTDSDTSSPLRTSLDGNGKIYSCTVTATNSVGVSAPSTAVTLTTT
jgi:titin